MIPKPFKTLAYSTALSALLAGGALADDFNPATQTAPGESVINTVTLTYNGAGDTTVELPSDDAHTATFTVARKIDLSLVAQTSEGETTQMPGASAVALAFTLRNLGNGNEDYNINVSNTGGGLPGDGLVVGDTFEGLTYSDVTTTDPGFYYVQVDGDDYDKDSGSVVSLAPGETATITIIANIPTIATDGLEDLFVVTAITIDENGAPVEEDRNNALDSATPNVVFADAATDWSFEGGEADAERNGQDADNTNLRITAPVITATKTAAVVDEGLPGSSFDCAAGSGNPVPASPVAAIPGACVEYTITVENNSDSETAATNITITDPIPEFTTYAGSNSVTGFDTPNFDPNAGDYGTVTATVASLDDGATASFTIRVTID